MSVTSFPRPAMEDAAEGDLVEAVKGETVIRGRVKYSDDVGALYLDAGERLLLEYLTDTLDYALTVIAKFEAHS